MVNVSKRFTKEVDLLTCGAKFSETVRVFTIKPWVLAPGVNRKVKRFKIRRKSFFRKMKANSTTLEPCPFIVPLGHEIRAVHATDRIHLLPLRLGNTV